jgi:hypothetical protein
MTTRYEGAGAKDTAITIHEAGEEIGEEVVPEGQMALAFNYDEVFYIQGAPAEISEFLARAARAFNQARYAEEEGDLPLILALDDDYCPTSKDNKHRWAEDRTCDLCGASEEEP